jgi:hypothetical protein
MSAKQTRDQSVEQKMGNGGPARVIQDFGIVYVSAEVAIACK